ncbi:hypothetical protein MTO96_031102 [Rhipicephalus appendiculatus]
MDARKTPVRERRPGRRGRRPREKTPLVVCDERRTDASEPASRRGRRGDVSLAEGHGNGESGPVPASGA